MTGIQQKAVRFSIDNVIAAGNASAGPKVHRHDASLLSPPLSSSSLWMSKREKEISCLSTDETINVMQSSFLQHSEEIRTIMLLHKITSQKKSGVVDDDNDDGGWSTLYEFMELSAGIEIRGLESMLSDDHHQRRTTQRQSVRSAVLEQQQKIRNGMQREEAIAKVSRELSHSSSRLALQLAKADACYVEQERQRAQAQARRKEVLTTKTTMTEKKLCNGDTTVKTSNRHSRSTKKMERRGSTGTRLIGRLFGDRTKKFGASAA